MNTHVTAGMVICALWVYPFTQGCLYTCSWIPSSLQITDHSKVLHTLIKNSKQPGCPEEPQQRQNRKQPDHCGPKRIFFNVPPNYWDLMKSICIHILRGGSLIPGYTWAKKCHYADKIKTLANKQIIALLMSTYWFICWKLTKHLIINCVVNI